MTGPVLPPSPRHKHNPCDPPLCTLYKGCIFLQMPKRKRTSSTRRRGTRRRFRSGTRVRRRNRTRRKPLALKQHAFCERAENEREIRIDTEAAAAGVFESFTLTKMRQQSAYCSLFEFYRIDKVVATFRYKGGTAQIAVDNDYTTNEVNPLLYFKVDHNDETADTLSTLKDSLKTKTHMFTNNKPEFSIQLKPAIQMEMFKSSLTTAYTPKWGTWIPTTDPTVPHYGLKTYAIAFKSASYNPGTIAVSFKYYVSFKNNE